jgi:putative transposase
MKQTLEQKPKQHSVQSLCTALQVSRAGYYAWVKRQSTLTDKVVAQSAIETAAIQAHQAARGSYGPKRLQTALIQVGHSRSISSIKRLRRRLNLRCVGKKRWVCTTDSKHSLPVADNLLQQRFDTATAPNQIWVADITYIPTDEGWLYLAGLKDLYSKAIVGWAMQPHMQSSLVEQALQMAVQRHAPPPGLIAHSDRGSQYASHSYSALLSKHQMRASMSRRGNCYENKRSAVSRPEGARARARHNAPMESFWASLKKEQVHQQHYQTRAQAQSDIFSYIETFYNTTRLHSGLGNKSPAQFEQEYWQRQNSTEPQAQGESLPPAPPSSLKQFNEDQSANVAALH